MSENAQIPAAAAPTELPKQWDPVSVEPRLYEQWEAAGLFTADAASRKPPFAIMLPPPNVTGSLHMGHAFQHTLMDALCRYHRMSGHEVLWMPGMDHAGIATQTLVERQLADEGTSREELGRERFTERVWQWKRTYGGQILDQMRRLGDSVDWSRERFTMDEGLSTAVNTIFHQLYTDGLIYRAERMVNWSPGLQSALSDIEVDYEDVAGELVSMRYGDGDDSVVVATTRVETMLGDTAVAVHPDDQRYAHLVGRSVRLPIVDREIPVIADEHVDPEFGTGCVKVTPAHDPNDFAIGQRHGLPRPVIMDPAGAITGTGTRFDGMDRFQAREAVREQLRADGRIVSETRPYIHSVGHCSRTGAPIEPRLSLQWWVAVERLAEQAGRAVRDGRTSLHPATMENRWFDWVDGMHDWCISRQLWWGHRIPVYYGPQGQVHCPAPGEEPPAGWERDPDVLDTWFSSALWPMSTLGWPDDTADLAKFYPTSVLLTGHDILFFWVARMMMFGLYAQQRQPFDTVVLTGLVRDGSGQKMSKSKGNVVDPMDWLAGYGADALRFTLAGGANPGTDVAVSEEAVSASRSFCTKLWNATRFALGNGAKVGRLPERARLTEADRWILDRLAGLTADAQSYLQDYEFAKLADALYHFTWDEFCDWYVELAKVVLEHEQHTPAEADAAENTRLVLGHLLHTLLRLLHPLIPFITERLWQALDGRDWLMRQPWPSPAEAAGAQAGDPGWMPDETAAARIADVQQLVTELRRFRADQGLRPGQRVSASIEGPGLAELDGLLPAVRSLARLDPVQQQPQAPAELELGLAGGTATVRIDLAEAVDLDAERARLRKDLQAAEAELAKTEGQLANPSFTGKAPPAVVDKIRARHAAAQQDVDRISSRLQTLPEATR